MQDKDKVSLGELDVVFVTEEVPVQEEEVDNSYASDDLGIPKDEEEASNVDESNSTGDIDVQTLQC